MANNPYAPCPGGLDKKVKFCCPDLLDELDKLDRMMVSGQYAAALEAVSLVEAKTPGRACLMAIKAQLLDATGQAEQAQAAATAFAEKFPNSPVALAEAALTAAHNEAPTAAGLVQQALEAAGDSPPGVIFEAAAVAANSLVRRGRLIAARAYLTLAMAADREPHEQLLMMLAAISASRAPLLLRGDLMLAPCPADALWKRGFDESIALANRGLWRQAAEQLEALAGKVGDWPALWFNVGVLRAYIDDTAGAVAAWRKYLAQNVPPDDAVEVEALVQLIEPTHDDDIDLVELTLAIDDYERFNELVSGERRLARMPLDPAMLATEGSPPPKGALHVLDRPMPASVTSAADVPRMLADAFVYGRETDRPARLVLMGNRGQLEAARRVFDESTSGTLGAVLEERVLGKIPRGQEALSARLRLPDGSPPEVIDAIEAEERRASVEERWPAVPQALLDGKTLREAAADPALRVKALAAILNLELSAAGDTEDFDFNALRRQLGLPEEIPLPWGGVAEAVVPAARLARVDAKTIPDEAIDLAYQRALMVRHAPTMRRIGSEILSRASLANRIDFATIHGELARVAPRPEEALDHVRAARQISTAHGRSCATWDLTELGLQLAIGGIDESSRLLGHLQATHMREAGVAQALLQLLVRYGIVNPDGSPAMPTAPQAPDIVVPGAAAATGGKLWTPDSAAAPVGGKKSAIWTPE